MKKLLIFDFDGVIFDSTKVATDYLRTLFPLATEEEIRTILIGNFHESMERLTALYPSQDTEEEKILRRERYAKNKLGVKTYAGMINLLNDLHAAGYILTLNTSAANANCIPLLDREKITHLFDFLGTKEIAKSKVEKFKLIQEAYHVMSEDTLFITDTLGDLEEAATDNTPTIGVTWGAHTRDILTSGGHKNLVQVVDQVDELREYILKL